jgi:hypothetical protein
MEVATLQRRVHQRLDDELVAAYQRDGAVCIRQLLDRDELALLRDGIEANLAQPSPAGQGAPMDQQEIAADMALSMVRPLADQRVIAAAAEMKAFAQAARGSKFPTVGSHLAPSGGIARLRKIHHDQRSASQSQGSDAGAMSQFAIAHNSGVARTVGKASAPSKSDAPRCSSRNAMLDPFGVAESVAVVRAANSSIVGALPRRAGSTSALSRSLRRRRSAAR